MDNRDMTKLQLKNNLFRLDKEHLKCSMGYSCTTGQGASFLLVKRIYLIFGARLIICAMR